MIRIHHDAITKKALIQARNSACNSFHKNRCNSELKHPQETPRTRKCLNGVFQAKVLLSNSKLIKQYPEKLQKLLVSTKIIFKDDKQTIKKLLFSLLAPYLWCNLQNKNIFKEMFRFFLIIN